MTDHDPNTVADTDMPRPPDSPADHVSASVTSRSIQVGVLTILVFFVGFGAWAGMAPLDGAIIGSGALTVHGNTKTVQHKEGGIISALLVQNGDRVVQDQVLLRLDDTQIRAVLNVHEAQLAGDRALCARDLAELSDTDDLVFPTDLGASDEVAHSVMTRERVMFRNHRMMLAEQLGIADERLRQAAQQLVGATAQHDAAQRGLIYGTQELQAMTTLERMGLAARNTVLQLSRSLEALRGETGQLQSDIARHGAEMAELRAEKLRLRSESQGEATREMREAQLRINDVIPRIAADRDLLARLDVRAPETGQVLNLQAFTRGGVIEPGKPVLEIVPDARRVVASVQIRPEDIEHLHIGQRARVIATGFNSRDTEPLDGRVDVISADCITDPRTGRSYYTMEVSLLGDHDSGRLMHQLAPGMPVEVVVPVKPRTALDYLTEPLRTSLRTAGHEM